MLDDSRVRRPTPVTGGYPNWYWFAGGYQLFCFYNHRMHVFLSSLLDHGLFAYSFPRRESVEFHVFDIYRTNRHIIRRAPIRHF